MPSASTGLRLGLLALAVLGLLARPVPTAAQPAAPPTPGPATAVSPTPGPPVATSPTLAPNEPLASAPAAPGPLGFFADPGAWATTVFNTALVGLARNTSTDIVSVMGWLLGNGNVISQTPPLLSYDNDAVRQLWGVMRSVANAGLAVVAAAGGLSLILNPHIRAPYHGALELIPRLLLGGLLVNTSLGWGRFVIDLNNALCQALGTREIPAWSTILQQPVNSLLVELVALLVYLLMGILLLVQMLMRLALVDVLLAIAPLALLGWVLPQTNGWARLWFTTFLGTVFAQFLQVLVLQLGVQLIRLLPTLLQGAATNAPDNGREWLVGLLLGVAVLQLARKVPRLLPGVFGGGGDMLPIGLVRSLAFRGAGLIVGAARTGGR
jgi:TrbL/VirB6 plasmid conjugal transfer protein